MADKETGDLAETGARPLPEPDVDPASRWLPSLVWLIPLLAALIGAGLAAKSILDQGPTVTVSFKSAEGLSRARPRSNTRMSISARCAPSPWATT